MVNTLAVDSEAKQTIEALQAELKKTKERLQAVEELKGQAGMQPHHFYGSWFGCLLFSYISFASNILC
jgi:ABC-type Fe3+-hydroxamate transport system substrate-binding protein